MVKLQFGKFAIPAVTVAVLALSGVPAKAKFAECHTGCGVVNGKRLCGIKVCSFSPTTITVNKPKQQNAAPSPGNTVPTHRSSNSHK